MVAVWLAATNPTMETYLQFVEARLSAEIEKMDQSGPRRDRDLIKAVFRAQGPKLVEGLSGRIRSETTGVCSVSLKQTCWTNRYWCWESAANLSHYEGLRRRRSRSVGSHFDLCHKFSRLPVKSFFHS